MKLHCLSKTIVSNRIERYSNQSGITMILTLGLLALLMMVMLSLAITARTERRAAEMNADVVRARMLAESALGRALAFMHTEFQGENYPGSRFYQAPADSPWSGRAYLGSINGSDTAGIEQALSLRLKNVEFNPSAQLHSSIGWIPITSSRQILGQEREVLIGRYCYLIIDESGKIDPGAVVSPIQPETAKLSERDGNSPADISLASLGIANPDRLRPRSVDVGVPGLMPSNGRWFSMSHIVNALQPSQAQFDIIKRTLHPFSYDVEMFWRDTNNNGRWDEGEDQERLDLSGDWDAQELYSTFLGEHENSPDDDCAWLKETDNNPWSADLKDRFGLTTTQVRQRIAAQITANMIDFADADSVPTLLYIDNQGALHNGTGTAPDDYNVQGVERTWGISEVAMQVTVEVGGVKEHTISGNININPGKSANNSFIMRTPSGQIDIDTLHSEGAGYTYSGPATSVAFKPKSTGRILVIDGETVSLSPNTRYSIHSNAMTVFLRNSHPGAKNWPQAQGHWWIQISATNATITPDPVGGKPDLIFTPAFKGEIYFPFAENAEQSNPPGTLSVMYTVRVQTATGKSGTAQGAVAVEMNEQDNFDGGTLVFSKHFTEAGSVTIEDALDPDHSPALDWHTVSLARIDRIELHDQSGAVIAAAPFFINDNNSFRTWTQSGTSRGGHRTYYASASAIDPMLNNRGQNDNDFKDYWSSLPEGVHLSNLDVGQIGKLPGTGFQSADYCDVDVKNAPFTKLGELGRVHSYQPFRSLRFWAADAAAESGHDADILDLFRLSEQKQTRGRVNINTLQSQVLYALFDGIITKSPRDAVKAVLDKRQNSSFTTAAQIFGGVAGLTGDDPAQDSLEEAAVAKLAELITVRPNYFTILACAQAIRDVGNLKYDSNGDGELDQTSAFKRIDVRYNQDGSVAGYADRILAEQKILATVYRDAYTNEIRVERYDYVQ